jgi:microcystin-dependent protein
LCDLSIVTFPTTIFNPNIKLLANTTYFAKIYLSSPTYTGSDFIDVTSTVPAFPPILTGGYQYSYDDNTYYQNNSQVLTLTISGDYSNSYSTVISTTQISNFIFWGKFFTMDSQPSGSSITYRIRPQLSWTDTSQSWQTISNNTVLPYTSGYMGIEMDFSRTVSTAVPVVNTAGFNINYAPPLLSVNTTNYWTGTNTFIGIVNGVIPVGSVQMYVSTNAPTGWLLCDGTNVSTTTYSSLYAVIEFTYGNPGGGSMTLPDFRGVYPKGAGTTNRTLGKNSHGDFYSGTLGLYSTDHIQMHHHSFFYSAGNPDGALGTFYPTRGNTASSVEDDHSLISLPNAYLDSTYGAARVGTTTEPQSLGINFIIKY